MLVIVTIVIGRNSNLENTLEKKVENKTYYETALKGGNLPSTISKDTYLEAGTYTLNSNLTIPEGVTLEVDELNNEIARNLYGHALVTREVENEKGYYLYNGHGDVVKIVDTSNEVLNEYTYDAWGGVLTSIEELDNPYRYVGYYYDEEITQNAIQFYKRLAILIHFSYICSRVIVWQIQMIF